MFMYDIAIKNGIIVDGTRAKPRAANLYIQDGKIAAISEDDREAAKVYDARGHIVAPGFIDNHSHSDVSYLNTDIMEAGLIAGVTCNVAGQCGGSIVPLNEKNINSQLKGMSGLHRYKLTPETFKPRDFTSYCADVSEKGCSVNMALFIGHGTLRSAVIGWELRQLTPEELAQMCALLDDLLYQGAAGVSFGLIYPPGSFCNTDEVIALAKVVAKHDKILGVHMRNENKGVFDALDEMIHVAEVSGCKLEISHLKLMGKTQWGRADELLNKIDLARARGVRIHADQYPYTSSHSALTSCFPKWALDGGFGKFLERVKDDSQWAAIVADGLPEMYERGGPENITVSDFNGDEAYPEAMGKTLVEIAEMLHLPLLDAVRHVLIRGAGQVACFYKNMNEEDVLKIMSRRDICVISDGTIYDMHNYNGRPHPRCTGTFPRFLRLVREHSLMSIEDAVYKMTGLPATLLRLDDRVGFLKEGMEATITVFDKDSVSDRATFEQPTLPPVGIDLVFVSGRCVLDNGVFTAERPGRVLKVESR